MPLFWTSFFCRKGGFFAAAPPWPWCCATGAPRTSTPRISRSWSTRRKAASRPPISRARCGRAGGVPFPIRADCDTVRRHLSSGRPLVALLRSSANRLHYVVLTGYSGDELVLHDPSLGPHRRRSVESVFEDWAASDFWALLVLPPDSPEAPEEPMPTRV